MRIVDRISSRLAGPLAIAFFALAAQGCNQSAGEVREWRPSDHDNTENPNNDNAMSDGGPGGVMGVDEVALAAWKGKCVTCHGIIGRGDGPKGASVRARDLTDPAWQASVTDAQLAASLRNGKGQMPKSELPDSTIQGLIRLVRLLNASRAASGPGDAGSASDAGHTDAGKPRSDAGARDAGARPLARHDAGALP